jgi:type I restriction enzyme S subunit
MGNTPKIRFRGYTDEWEQRKLGDVTTSYSGGTPQAGNSEYYNGDIPFIRSGEIYEEHTELFITEKGMNNSSAKMVSKGDILYALYGATSGEVNRAKLVGAINQAILAVIPCECYDADFLVEWLRKEKDNITEKYLQGGQGNLSAQIIKNLQIQLPLFEEQKKIGKYFEKLNSCITLQQRKCEETKQLKKYMLQKMFPPKGQKTPEIRFAGFTDEWERRKFGDLGSVSMCKRIFKEQTTTEGEIPFYKIGTFGGEADAFISRGLFEEYKEKFQYPKVGDMLISASGTIGRTVEYKGEEAYFQDSNIVWFKHDKRIDNSFLKCIYSFVEWSGIEGSTIKRLYNDNFLKTEFCMPSVEEQQKIGSYFSNLDTLLTHHQRKCDDLKQLKQFMLQNMFV